MRLIRFTTLKRFADMYGVKVQRNSKRSIEVWYVDSCVSECKTVQEALGEVWSYIQQYGLQRQLNPYK